MFFPDLFNVSPKREKTFTVSIQPNLTVHACYVTNMYIDSMRDTGCYILMITTDKSDGPNGVFCLSKSNVHEMGKVNELASSIGKNNEKINVTWRPGEYPLIQYLNGKDNNKCILKVRLI